MKLLSWLSILTLALSPEALIAAPEVQLTTPVASQVQLVLPHQQKPTVVAAQKAIWQVTGKSGISMEAFSDPSSKRAYVGLKYPLYVAVAGGTGGIAGVSSGFEYTAAWPVDEKALPTVEELWRRARENAPTFPARLSAPRRIRSAFAELRSQPRPYQVEEVTSDGTMLEVKLLSPWGEHSAVLTLDTRP